MLMILEISESGDWQTHPASPRLVSSPLQIPPNRRPTMLQPDRETAEREALRLAREHPRGRFVVFEAVAAGITAKVPTHTTLSGKVVAERDIATLVHFKDEDDGIPF